MPSVIIGGNLPGGSGEETFLKIINLFFTIFAVTPLEKSVVLHVNKLVFMSHRAAFLKPSFLNLKKVIFRVINVIFTFLSALVKYCPWLFIINIQLLGFALPKDAKFGLCILPALEKERWS